MTDKKTKTQSYGLHYTATPGKSYLIEPKGGALNYDLAYRNPKKFYQKVLTQKVTQHKVIDGKNSSCNITSKVTQRKIGKILSAIQSKLSALVK